MRSARKQEKLQKKEMKKENRLKSVSKVISIIYMLAAVCFVALIVRLNMVPAKYLYPMIGVILVISLFIVPVMFSRFGKSGRRKGAMGAAVALILLFAVGIYYTETTLDFFGSITNIGGAKEEFYLVVKADSSYEKADDIKGKTVGVYSGAEAAYAEARQELKDKADVEYEYVDSLPELMNSLLGENILSSGGQQDGMGAAAPNRQQSGVGTAGAGAGSQGASFAAGSSPAYGSAQSYGSGASYNAGPSYDGGMYGGTQQAIERPAIFISAAGYESMVGQNSSIEEKTKIIEKISIRIESKSTTDHVNVTKEPFNILVSGLDTTGDIDVVSRSDVNMIVTVNPKTHQILLTSVPRDSYVELASKGAKDKLTHSGIYGVSETVSTVEKFMGIDINYYVKVNYSTVIKLVDAIGGIDIDSPFMFSTHGMKARYTFQKGYNHLDGSQALAYSRERKSFNDGDIQRNKNQQIILGAIIEKATNSKTVLSEYTSILGAIKDNLETDMEQKSMASLIKMQLGDMPSWNIDKQSVTGESGSGYCYALGSYASVVFTDEASVASAMDNIMEVMAGGEK